MSGLWGVLLLFLRLGMVSFGSGSSVLSEMERVTVANGWMTQTQFVQAYAISQITPGPQILFTTIVGYYAAGYAGAALATTAFCLPPALLMVVLGGWWSRRMSSPWPDAIRRSLRPVAVGLIAASAYTLAPTALGTWWAVAIAVGCFVWINWRPRFTPIFVVGTGAMIGAVAHLVVH